PDTFWIMALSRCAHVVETIADDDGVSHGLPQCINNNASIIISNIPQLCGGGYRWRQGLCDASLQDQSVAQPRIGNRRPHAPCAKAGQARARRTSDDLGQIPGGCSAISSLFA